MSCYEYIDMDGNAYDVQGAANAKLTKDTSKGLIELLISKKVEFIPWRGPNTPLDMTGTSLWSVENPAVIKNDSQLISELKDNFWNDPCPDMLLPQISKHSWKKLACVSVIAAAGLIATVGALCSWNKFTYN
jgi:hypothetical protein